MLHQVLSFDVSFLAPITLENLSRLKFVLNFPNIKINSMRPKVLIESALEEACVSTIFTEKFLIFLVAQEDMTAHVLPESRLRL
jgi:hypothetical protein